MDSRQTDSDYSNGNNTSQQNESVENNNQSNNHEQNPSGGVVSCALLPDSYINANQKEIILDIYRREILEQGNSRLDFKEIVSRVSDLSCIERQKVRDTLSEYMKKDGRIEKFISVVKKYPIIYDTTLQEFKDFRKKENVWNTVISHEMNGENGENLKRQWLKLKDRYLRYCRANTTDDDSSSRFKNWKWAKHLDFLQPNLRFPGFSGNVEDGMNSIHRNIEQAIQEHNVQFDTGTINQTATGPSSIDEIESCTLEPIPFSFHKEWASLFDKTQEDDPDLQFLVSLLPDFKKLNDAQKLDFRIHTLQFFKNIRSLNSSNVFRHTRLHLEHQDQINPQYSPDFLEPNQNL